MKAQKTKIKAKKIQGREQRKKKTSTQWVHHQTMAEKKTEETKFSKNKSIGKGFFNFIPPFPDTPNL